MVRDPTQRESTEAAATVTRMPSRRSFTALSALLALLAALALGACGSSDESASSVLRQTFSTHRDVKVSSGRVTLALDSSLQGVQGLSGQDSIHLSGPFASGTRGQAPRFDFTLSRNQAGQGITAGIVSTGTEGFVRFGGQAYSLSDQLYARLRQVATGGRNGSSIAPSLGALGVNPQRWLVDPHTVGEAEVGGTKTVHIAAKVDVPRFLQDASRLLARASAVTRGQTPAAASLTPQQLAAIQRVVSQATVDVYSGQDDKLLRRIDLRVATRPSGKSRGGSLHFVLELDDLNGEQNITAPAGAQPLASLLTALQGQGGGAATPALPSTGGGTATPAPPSTGGATTTPAAPSTGGSSRQQQYLGCLGQAGSDLARQQACAKFL